MIVVLGINSSRLVMNKITDIIAIPKIADLRMFKISCKLANRQIPL